MKKKQVVFLVIMISFLVATKVSAHQLRVVLGTKTEVQSPEISQAFYGELNGQSEIFEITADAPFNLYAAILSPYRENAEKDFVLNIFKNDVMIAGLDSTQSKWLKFYEQFGGRDYLLGPEYKNEIISADSAKGKTAEAGVYRVEVSSSDNVGEYILVIGERDMSIPVSMLRNTKNGVNNVQGNMVLKSGFDFLFGRSAIYLLVPVVMLLMFFAAGVIITIMLAKQRWKEGHVRMDRK